MTLIRDPVQRFLSHYFYCREVAQSGIIFDADAVELSLSEYIDKTLYSNPKQDLYNGQCWHLFGVPSYEEKKQRLESFLDSKLFCIPVERVEQSALFLNRNLASTFSSKKVQRLNSSSSKKKPQVSNQLLERIRCRMDLDIILYQHSNTLFNTYVQPSLAVSAFQLPMAWHPSRLVSLCRVFLKSLSG